MNHQLYLSLILVIGMLCSCQTNASISTNTPKHDPVSDSMMTASLRYAITSKLHSFDPAPMNLQAQIDFILNLYEGLMIHTGDGDVPVLGLAESIEVQDEGLTQLVTLRKGLKWSDGVPLTTDDVYYAFRRVLTPDRFVEGLPYYNHLLEIIHNATAYKEETLESLPEKPIQRLEEYQAYFSEVGIEVVDTHQIKFKLDYPIPYFKQILAQPNYYPLPRHILESNPENWATAEKIICSGPFVPESVTWASNDDTETETNLKSIGHVTLIPNPYYWDRDSVKLTRVEVDFFETKFAMSLIYQRYMQGIYDFVPNLFNTPTTEWNLQPRNDLIVKSSPAVYFYILNVSKPPLSNPVLRQALNLAIDRKSLVDHVAKEGERPAYTYVPQIIKGYHAPETGISYNPKKARALLEEEYGSPGNVPSFHIEAMRGSGDVATGNFILQNFRDIGLNVQIEYVDQENFASYFMKAKTGNFFFFRLAWNPDVLDPLDYLRLFQKDHLINLGQFNNADYERLLKESMQTTDYNERLTLLREAESILLQNYILIPLFYLTNRMLVRPNVKGLYLNERNLHPLKYIYFTQ